MIDLTLSTDEADLARSVREVAAKEFPLEEGVRAAMDGRPEFDQRRWSRIAALGWLGVSVPADAGGVGMGLPQEMLVFLELGRSAASGPFVGSATAAYLAARAGQHELAERVLAGRERVGLIVDDLVIDAGAGELGLRLSAAGAELVRLEGLDPVESVDDAVNIGRVVTTSPVLQADGAEIADRLRVLVGAYLVGLAQAGTDMSVEYAKTREQFGRPVGTFQAVKHRCAEMAVRAYVARSQLAVGAVLAEGGRGGRLEIAAGFLLALRAAQQNSEDNVQNHGGIGFTSEHPAGVLVKRVQVYRRLGGKVTDVVQLALSAAESNATGVPK
jgi:alkylation response protein AidB-like acyl-CoA dehydrogenase